MIPDIRHYLLFAVMHSAFINIYHMCLFVGRYDPVEDDIRRPSQAKMEMGDFQLLLRKLGNRFIMISARNHPKDYSNIKCIKGGLHLTLFLLIVH